jgi:small neutral amino acid transporter SnatA (MarC family)
VNGWLVAIAVIAAVNPPRLAPALPRQDRTPGERVVVAAVGASLAAAVLALFVVVGGPVAEWLDVSAPTLAVGAGLVLALAAIGQAVREPRAEPSLPGRRAALVPVAVPFVLRPEVGLLCLAAGAGDAPLGAIVGLGGAIVGIAVGARVEVAGTTGRLTRWRGRVLAAVALVAGIAITVDGVVAV